jgi:hypothetical protein
MITIKRDKNRPNEWWIRNGKSTWGPYCLPRDIEALNLQVAEILIYKAKEIG